MNEWWLVDDQLGEKLTYPSIFGDSHNSWKMDIPFWTNEYSIFSRGPRWCRHRIGIAPAPCQILSCFTKHQSLGYTISDNPILVKSYEDFSLKKVTDSTPSKHQSIDNMACPKHQIPAFSGDFKLADLRNSLWSSFRDLFFSGIFTGNPILHGKNPWFAGRFFLKPTQSIGKPIPE